MHLVRDLRFTVRRLTAHPWGAGLIVLTIGLGIGAATAVFTLVDSILLRPPPFAHAGRLVDVFDTSRRGGGIGGNSLTPRKIVGWQSQTAAFERFEAYAPLQVDLTGGVEPERVRGESVSVGLFSMLGVQPALGRDFRPGEGRPGGEAVVVISDALWRRRFASRPDVLGERILLNDREHTVIGVMPRRFRLLHDEESLWLPVDLAANVDHPDAPRGFYGIGRLAPGVAGASAQPVVDRIAERLASEMPLPQTPGGLRAPTWDLSLRPKAVASVRPETRRALLVLLGAVAFVLLITCANVANLFLSQAPARAREMAVRSALGAGRWSLVRSVIVESVLLATAGGALGMLFAEAIVEAVVAVMPSRLASMTTTTIEIDGRVGTVAAAMTLATGFLFGLVPAIRGSRPDLDRSLRGGGDSRARASYGRVPGTLVIAEAGLSVVLLIGAALMIRTLARLHAIEPGFDPGGLVSMQVNLPSDRYPTSMARATFFEALIDRLKQQPGIAAASVSVGVPPALGGFTVGLPETEGGPPPLSSGSIYVPFDTVTPGYFDTLRIPFVAGRNFGSREPSDSAIISRSFADRFWPNGAVGRRFRMRADQEWMTIVGVVRDVEARVALDERTALQLYHPWRIAPPTPREVAAGSRRRAYHWSLLVVRAENASAAVPAITAQIRALDPNQPIEDVALVTDVYAEAFARQRFVMLVLGAFAALALLLTAAGIFAVMSQAVAQRTREIGIRVALGAKPSDVVALFLSSAAKLTLAGAALGLAAALALASTLRSLLFEIGPHDPLSFAAVAFALVVVALVACWVPTRAALRVRPSIALRAE